VELAGASKINGRKAESYQDRPAKHVCRRRNPGRIKLENCRRKILGKWRRFLRKGQWLNTNKVAESKNKRVEMSKGESSQGKKGHTPVHQRQGSGYVKKEKGSKEEKDRKKNWSQGGEIPKNLSFCQGDPALKGKVQSDKKWKTGGILRKHSEKDDKPI